MSGRSEAFINYLEEKKVLQPAALHGYMDVVSAFEEALGLEGVRPFGPPEIDQFLAFRQKAGDSDQALQNYGVVCRAYLVWCHNRKLGGVIPPNRPIDEKLIGMALEGMEPPPSKDGTPMALPPPASSPEQAAQTNSAQGGQAPHPQAHPQGATVTPESPNPPPPAAPVEKAWLSSRNFLWGGLVVAAMITGCITDSVRQANRISEFGLALRREAKKTTGIDQPDLEARVNRVIVEYRVKKPQVLAHVGYLKPTNINNLMPSERMQVAEAMQRQQQKMAGASRGDRIEEPPPFYYVEVAVRGEMPGMFGAKGFDLTNSVVVGGGID